MKVAVIGVGSMGRLHAQLLAGLSDVDGVVVADLDPNRAEAVAFEVRGRSMTVENAIGTSDAVVLATPAEHHRAPFEAALDAGRPILCEKPLGSDLAETLAMAERAEGDGATVQLGFQRRFDAGFREAHRMAVSGSLGDPTLLRLTAHDPRVPSPPLRAQGAPPLDAAPLFRDSTIHDFDLARWLIGDEVVEVAAEGSARDRSRPSDPALVETAVVTLRFGSGALAVIDATLLDPRGYDVRAELIGTRDSVAIGLTPRTPVRVVDPDAAPSDRRVWRSYLDRFRDAYRAELEEFLRAARGDRPTSVGVRDGVEAMRLAVAATASHVEARRVSLSEVPGLSGTSVTRGAA